MTFTQRYWAAAVPLWPLATGVVAVVAALGSPTWADLVAFAFGWGMFAFALWWALDTARSYQAGQLTTSPGAILDRRLASGEISVDEYERRRQALDAG